MKKKKAMILILVIAVFLLPKTITCLSNLGYDTGRTKTFTSQNGERSVIVKQDFVSRPHVFYEGNRIFTFEGSGFMESVQWSVTFLDENTISLTSDPHIGEYFEIKLDHVSSGAERKSQNLWFSLVGGIIFWMSPFCFCYLWNQSTKKVTKKLVNSLSLAEKEHLKEIQQEFIFNEQYYWKQKGKIMEVKPKGKRIVCIVLWYNEELPRIPSYENFRYSTVKPTLEEFNQLKQKENATTTLVIRSNKARRVAIAGFWLKLDG